MSETASPFPKSQKQFKVRTGRTAFISVEINYYVKVQQQ